MYHSRQLYDGLQAQRAAVRARSRSGATYKPARQTGLLNEPAWPPSNYTTRLSHVVAVNGAVWEPTVARANFAAGRTCLAWGQGRTWRGVDVACEGE
jgi:hypothetical protein